MVRLNLNKDLIFKLIYESMPKASLNEAETILHREDFQEIKFILLDYIEMVSANIFTVDKISIPDIPSVEL